jgi:MFS family permease
MLLKKEVDTKDLTKKFYPVIVASASFFLSYYTRLTWSILSSYMPFHPTVIQDSHVFALYFLSYIIVQIPAGFLSDRYQGGKVIAISLIALAIASFFSGIAVNIKQEYIASFFMGLSAGWIYPASLNVIKYYYNKEERAVFLGYYSIAWPLAIVVSGLLLPSIALHIGWMWGYYSSAILCLIFAALAYPLKTHKSFSKINFLVIKDKNVILLSLGGFLFFSSYWSIMLYAYKYFIEIGIKSMEAGFLFSAMAIIGLFSSAISGFIVNKFELKSSIISAIFAYALLTASLTLTHSYLILFLIVMAMGFVRFIIVPLNASILILIGKQNVGSVTGISNLFWQSSGIFGPLISSVFINSFGFHYFWLIMGAIILVSIPFYLLIEMNP